jgi:SsrA-binding protein
MTKKDNQKFSNRINIVNRKARFEYKFLDTYTAGIILTGTEIKSIREGRINLQEAFCTFQDGELYIKQMHISPYTEGSYNNHEPTRMRKLLLSKKELRKLAGKADEKGLTIVPIRLFISEKGWAKLEIALAQGKKLYDKREDIKQKDMDRELSRIKF